MAENEAPASENENEVAEQEVDSSALEAAVDQAVAAGEGMGGLTEGSSG